MSIGVPNSPGVYLIYVNNEKEKHLVYAGMSGSLENDGKFKSQLLNGRLNNKQKGVKRQVFFSDKLIE